MPLVLPNVAVDFDKEIISSVTPEETQTRAEQSVNDKPVSETIEAEIVKDDDYDQLIERVFDKRSLPSISRMQQIAMEAHVDAGHTNIRDLISTARAGGGNEKLANFPLSFKLDLCYTCALAKSRARPLPKGPVERAHYVHERVFIDTTGKFRIRSYRGEYYATLTVDDCSDFVDCFCHAKKSDLLAQYKRWNAQHGRAPKYLRSDCAGESNNPLFEAQLLEDGTHHEKSAPESQHQNARVERKMGTIKGRSRANMVHSNVPAKFWS
jgi:hypothetical protein